MDVCARIPPTLCAASQRPSRETQTVAAETMGRWAGWNASLPRRPHRPQRNPSAAAAVAAQCTTGAPLFLERGERRPRRAQLRRELHRRRERRRVPAYAAPDTAHGQVPRPVAVTSARDPLTQPPRRTARPIAALRCGGDREPSLPRPRSARRRHAVGRGVACSAVVPCGTASLGMQAIPEGPWRVSGSGGPTVAQCHAHSGPVPCPQWPSAMAVSRDSRAGTHGLYIFSSGACSMKICAAPHPQRMRARALACGGRRCAAHTRGLNAAAPCGAWPDCELVWFVCCSVCARTARPPDRMARRFVFGCAAAPRPSPAPNRRARVRERAREGRRAV
jgi:hypothetical protein